MLEAVLNISFTGLCDGCTSQQEDVRYVPRTGWLCPPCRILALAVS